MQDLQEVTQEVHYENYRSERLAKGVIKNKNHINSNNNNDDVIANNHNNNNNLISSNTQSSNDNKDRILQEKEAELRRMQEMLAQMQAKMQAQQ